MTPPQQAGAFRLIVHIGAGKTGSTSIQQMLRSSADALADFNTAYWGLVLEHAPAQRHPWQSVSLVDDLSRLDAATAVPQITEVLEASIAMAEARGIRQAIWSNERFMKKGKAVCAALLNLAGRGVDVQVVAYVRRFDAWALSRYIQWGIKHKTYQGRQLTFSEFTAQTPNNTVAELRGWRDAFGTELAIRNYDAAGNVAADFLKLAGLPVERFAAERQNESPSPEEIALRAIFNDSISGRAPVAAFNRAFGPAPLPFDRSLQDMLQHLLPGEDELGQVAEAYRSDRETLDAWLAASGQPPVDTAPLNYNAPRIDTGRLLSALASIAIRQGARIRALEEKLDRRQGQHTTTNRKQT